MENLHVTSSKAESEQHINDTLVSYGQKPLNSNELKDWGLIGGESYADLEMWAKEFISECHTEACASKDAWRYEL